MQRLLTHVIAALSLCHVNEAALQPAQRLDLLECSPRSSLSRLHRRNESLHRTDTSRFMAGKSAHVDEPTTHSVHPVSLRFVSIGELPRDSPKIAYAFKVCCVHRQVSLSRVECERNDGTLSAPCHGQSKLCTYTLLSSYPGM